MRCPRCSTELPSSARFCLECGLPLTAGTEQQAGFVSPEAYTPRHLADRILTSRTALEGERKQVTVLFCDLVNSTPLAERLGPEGMHAFLSRFFDLALSEIHRFEGTVNQFLGDGLMALFGAPLAHEDDARRAVLAALGIRRALRDRASYMGAGHGNEVALRIGLNTGPVVVGRIGDNLRMDYTAIGDTTNVAARLQQIAAPWTVLISEATARLVRSDFRLTPMGPLAVKGKSDPVVAYSLLGRAPRRSLLERARERAFARFVARERELARLVAALRQTEQHGGCLVSVVGEAGVGKSRLLYEFRRSFGDRDITCLEGRCRSYGATVPYLPIIDIVRGHCAIADADTPETIAQKVRLALLEVGLDAGEDGPYVLQLLGVKASDELADVSPEATRARTIEILRRLLVESSRRRPLVLLLEDLHWIDTPSEAYLVSLVESLAGARLLVVATWRPGYRPPWRAQACATEIGLAPLSAADSASIVRSREGARALPDATVALILDKADGNPLFLEELTRAVTEGDGAVAVPDTLQSVLMSRIDRLPEATKRLLQTASVLGREFSLRLLAGIWDGPGDAAAHLETLARLEFVHEQVGAEEPAYAFNHALAQEVAYESLLTAHRQALHQAAARWLERSYAGRLDQVLERLAFHYARTEEAAMAIEYLARVAEKAARAYANAEAHRALAEALALAERLPDGRAADRARIRLALQKTHVLFTQGAFRESLQLLLAEQPRVEGFGEPLLAGPFYFRLGLVYGVLGDGARATAFAERALAEAERSGDAATMGKAHYILAREDFWCGRMLEGVEHGRRAVSLLEGTPERYWLSMAHWAMGLNYALLGEFDAALQALARAQAAGDKLGDARLLSNAAWTSGWVRAMRGEWAAGIEACKRSIEQAPDAVSRAVGQGFLGVVHLEEGDHAGARPALEQAVEAFATFGFPQLEGFFTIFLGYARWQDGGGAAARELITRGVRIAGFARFAPPIGAAERFLGAIALAEGKLADAEAHVREALRILEASAARFEVARTRIALAEVLQARGDARAAAEELREAHRLFVVLRVGQYVARTRELAEKLGVSLAPAP
jgi:class 3 adenylate cyclase/tetratricopeptide (TPR) repeat protein